MTPTGRERWAASLWTLPPLGAVAVVATLVQPLDLFTPALAVCALAASAGLLWWLADGPLTQGRRWMPWFWGMAAAVVVGAGSAFDYQLWFTDSRAWTVACHIVALFLVAGAGIGGGWEDGLKAALVAHLGATAAILVAFLSSWGTPLQTAVFQASGMLDAYEATGGADFPRWVTQACLSAVLPRTLGALTLGAVLGAVAKTLALRVKPQAKRA